MPPLQLTNLLHSSLPHVSQKGRALLSALACVNGHPESSTELAHWLGFHDRYQLARALKRERLPPVGTLSAWTHTLYWIIESQATGATLRELARREKMDPAVAYKLIRRVTGRRWSEVRREGLTGAVLGFRDRCRSVTAAPPVPAFAMEYASPSRPHVVRPLASAGGGCLGARWHTAGVADDCRRARAHPCRAERTGRLGLRDEPILRGG